MSIRLRVGVGAVALILAARLGTAGPVYTARDLYTVSAQQPANGYIYIVPGDQPQQEASGQLVGEGLYKQPSNGWTSFHAILWTPNGTLIDMSPTMLPGFDSTSNSGMLATDGLQQVGSASSAATGPGSHAILWSGTPASAIDLHPTNLAGFNSSESLGVGGGRQVGQGSGSATTVGGEIYEHALAWTGTANSAIDLHPTLLMGFTNSEALGTDGHHEVGFGTGIATPAIGTLSGHALLWKGTAESAVDLNPTNLPGFTVSIAQGVAGDQQVGVAYGGVAKNLYGHAMLWRGTADTSIDLNPTNLSGFDASGANATNGVQQIGGGEGTATTVNGRTYVHALVWSGSPDSAVDLSTFLPPGWINAEASSIDAAGDIFGLAYDASSNTHVIEWTPAQVPDPAGITLLLASGIILGMGARRRSAAC